MVHEYVNNGSDIYRESFRIIRSEANLDRFPTDVEGVVVRMIHAAADPAIADDIAFTPAVVTAARRALGDGAPILCDSSMTATGIIRSRLPRDNETICYIKDPRLADIAQAKDMTKTCAAVDLWTEEGKLDGAIVAIGNAPTALFHLLNRLAEPDFPRPAAIIGCPVGFIGAAESKAALMKDDPVPWCVVEGRLGGSAMTVAAVNALASARE